MQSKRVGLNTTAQNNLVFLRAIFVNGAADGTGAKFHGNKRRWSLFLGVAVRR